MAASDGRPDGLGARGMALWESLSDLRPFNAAERVVLAELCRMADRLDKLAALLDGDVEVWARIETQHNGRSHEIELTIDDGLAEARQIAVSFQRLAASLSLPAAPAKTKDAIDDLARRRSARLSG